MDMGVCPSETYPDVLYMLIHVPYGGLYDVHTITDSPICKSR